MDCVGCGSAAVTERPERTARGYRRFRCRDCSTQFNERSGGVLNRASLPSDIIAFVVFCRFALQADTASGNQGSTHTWVRTNLLVDRATISLKGSRTPALGVAEQAPNAGYEFILVLTKYR